MPISSAFICSIPLSEFRDFACRNAPPVAEKACVEIRTPFPWGFTFSHVSTDQNRCLSEKGVVIYLLYQEISDIGA